MSSHSNLKCPIKQANLSCKVIQHDRTPYIPVQLQCTVWCVEEGKRGGTVQRLLVYLQQHIHVSLSSDRVILYNRVRKKD